MSQEGIGRSGMRNKTKERGLVLNCSALLWDREACREQETAALVELIFHCLALPSSFQHVGPMDQGKVRYTVYMRRGRTRLVGSSLLGLSAALLDVS